MPADDKENARLIISRVVVETLKKLDMEYPEPSCSPKELKNLVSVGRKLVFA